MSPNFGKELREIRKQAEQQDWTVIKGKKYWKMYCDCPKKHKKTMHLSPSDPHYVTNLLGQLRRSTCWKG